MAKSNDNDNDTAPPSAARIDTAAAEAEMRPLLTGLKSLFELWGRLNKMNEDPEAAEAFIAEWSDDNLASKSRLFDCASTVVNLSATRLREDYENGSGNIAVTEGTILGLELVAASFEYWALRLQIAR